MRAQQQRVATPLIGVVERASSNSCVEMSSLLPRRDEEDEHQPVPVLCSAAQLTPGPPSHPGPGLSGEHVYWDTIKQYHT